MKIDHEMTATQLDAIAGQVQRWLDWNENERGKYDMTTTGETKIMSLPVPMWPTHDQFKVWIKAMNAASEGLRKTRDVP